MIVTTHIDNDTIQLYRAELYRRDQDLKSAPNGDEWRALNRKKIGVCDLALQGDPNARRRVVDWIVAGAEARAACGRGN